MSSNGAAPDKRIVVLISGGGSNLQALIDTAAKQQLGGQLVAVISNRPDAGGLQRARDAGIPTRVLDHRQFSDRAAFDQALAEIVDDQAPDLVVLAGFMRILTDRFVRHYLGRMLNIHPSLLPLYPGLKTHARALEAGDAEHGATVHFVTPDLDGGPPAAQVRVPVYSKDTTADLAARVLVQEHRLYPAVVRWFCQGRLQYRDGIAWFDGAPLHAPLAWSAGSDDQADKA